jgi:hypothetical protein
LIANEPFVGGGSVRGKYAPVTFLPSDHLRTNVCCNLNWMPALIDGFGVSAVEVAEEIENSG